METKILKVVRQGDSFSVQSAKAESGQIQKCTIVLREQGGSRSAEGRLPSKTFENEFVCSMLGNLAGCRFYEGDVGSHAPFLYARVSRAGVSGNPGHRHRENQ